MENVEAETIPDKVLIIRDEATPVTRVSNYDPVRFNAMKHGFLSKLTVRAHEDHAEFADLVTALIEVHRPAGMTERHLIEELAAIIWRKRRVLLAEGGRIKEGLQSAVSSQPVEQRYLDEFFARALGRKIQIPSFPAPQRLPPTH